MHVLLFAASPEHRKTVSRVEGLVALGATVAVAGYYRPTEADPLAKADYTRLGTAGFGDVLARALAMPLFAWRAIRFARSHKTCDCLWANTLDMLFLALLARPFIGGPRRIVYDVADLTAAQLDRGPKGALVRFIERIACRAVDVLLLTSPWFYWRYYVRYLPASASVFLLENKLSPPAPAPAPRPAGPPWRIVWHGRLRSPTSFAVARALAEALPDLVEIRAWGVAMDEMLNDLRAADAALANFSYHGPYSDSDIGPVFEGAHFLFAFDLDDGENSRLLLPNRLYHGVARAIPLVAPEDTAVGAVVAGLGLGRTFAPPYADAIVEFFRTLTGADYDALRAPFTDARRATAIYADDFARVARAIETGARTQALPAQERLDVVLASPGSGT